MKPTQSCPVVGLTVGSEPWLSRQLPPKKKQNAPEPAMYFGADHERAWSSE